MKSSVPVALLAALTLGSPASTFELAPGAATSISLGAVSGIAYFTAEPDGYRVVTTLAAGADASPVRFVATLARGQTITVAVPRPLGMTELRLNITRRGDALVVGEACPGCAAASKLVQSVGE